jgi:hypothetical protein
MADARAPNLISVENKHTTDLLTGVTSSSVSLIVNSVTTPLTYDEVVSLRDALSTALKRNWELRTEWEKQTRGISDL